MPAACTVAAIIDAAATKPIQRKTSEESLRLSMFVSFLISKNPVMTKVGKHIVCQNLLFDLRQTLATHLRNFQDLNEKSQPRHTSTS
jgi:hypothetical protein